jgi:hypothetical protein
MLEWLIYWRLGSVLRKLETGFGKFWKLVEVFSNAWKVLEIYCHENQKYIFCYLVLVLEILIMERFLKFKRTKLYESWPSVG